MSVYSDWKCGALSDDERKWCERMERGADHGERSDYEYDEIPEDEEILSDRP